MSEAETVPYDPTIILGRDNYHFKVLNCKLGTSKAGNPMLVQQLEFFDNPPQKIQGKMVDINGVKMTNWVVLIPSALGPLNSQRRALKLSVVSSPDQVSAEEYIGCEGDALAKTESKPMFNEVTGEPVIDRYTGKQMADSRLSVVSWFVKS